MTQTQKQIETEITYNRTVECLIGIHSSGARITEYKTIVVQPSDNVSYDPRQHDLTDPDTRAWWQEWCQAEGEFQVLRATHSQDELEMIAQTAGNADWSEVEQRLSDAADDDGIIAIINSLVEER